MLILLVGVGLGATPASASSNVCWGSVYFDEWIPPNSTSAVKFQTVLGPVISVDYNGDALEGSLSLTAVGRQVGNVEYVNLFNYRSTSQRAKGWVVTAVTCL